MSKEMGVILVGVWLLVLPYLGIPGTWRTTLLIVTGLSAMLLGFLLRGEALSRGVSRTDHRSSFVESGVEGN